MGGAEGVVDVEGDPERRGEEGEEEEESNLPASSSANACRSFPRQRGTCTFSSSTTPPSGQEARRGGQGGPTQSSILVTGEDGEAAAGPRCRAFLSAASSTGTSASVVSAGSLSPFLGPPDVRQQQHPGPARVR